MIANGPPTIGTAHDVSVTRAVKDSAGSPYTGPKAVLTQRLALQGFGQNKDVPPELESV
jgi:hypothetical protein